MNVSDSELWCIIYISSANERYDANEMRLLKEEVQRECESKAISGILIHAEGNLFCMIEGSKEAVILHYNKVKNDARHKNVVKLYDNYISYRYFEELGFTFKFIHGKEYTLLDDFEDAGKKAYLDECLDLNDKPMLRIREFIKNNQ